MTASPPAMDLVARTLQVSPEIWREVVADCGLARASTSDDETPQAELARRLPAIAAAYRRRSPHETPLPTVAGLERRCPICARSDVLPLLARLPGPMLYGRCGACGHGTLLSDGADAETRAPVHELADYYDRRTEAGAGYAEYGAEASYREAKGAHLIERLRTASRGAVESLLEVGSGFGYTRIAAERLGIRTAGVDVNRRAVAEAGRRYALSTFRGTLAEALADAGSHVASCAFDAVLYQFVLEHVVDPVAELRHAHRALRAGGWLALLVPSLDAAEVEVFGASYRSFRSDHLHLFSRASLAATLEAAGFPCFEIETGCNVHLLRGLVSERALANLYATGRGPDLLAFAEASP